MPEVTGSRLHAVAAELFAEHGYDSTSVRMVADGLGIKAGSLYYHIRSKESLLFDVINEALDRLIEGMLPTVNSDFSPGEKLWCALNNHIKIGCDTRNQMLVTIREQSKLSPEHNAVITDKRHSYELMYERLVREGIQAGEIRDFDEKLASYLLLGMANWVCQVYRPSGALSIEDFSRVCMQMIFAGVSSSGDAGRAPGSRCVQCPPVLLQK